MSGMTRQHALRAGLMLATCLPLNALGFSFADEEAKRQAENAPRAVSGAGIPAVCREKIKKERVVVLVAERGNQGVNADQGRYGAHFSAIDQRLRKLGLRTYSQEEIKKQIAQAEIDAHFRNDPDAALGAAKKLGASMTLRGLIVSRRSVNPVLNINEVAVSMQFQLVGANGRDIANTTASAESYAGADTLGMALTLVNEQAGSVVNRLMSAYCGRPQSDDE